MRTGGPRSASSRPDRDPGGDGVPVTTSSSSARRGVGKSTLLRKIESLGANGHSAVIFVDIDTLRGCPSQDVLIELLIELLASMERRLREKAVASISIHPDGGRGASLRSSRDTPAAPAVVERRNRVVRQTPLQRNIPARAPNVGTPH